MGIMAPKVRRSERHLLCHCDHCPNNTCATGTRGMCWAQMTLNDRGDIERSYNCFNQESSLMQSLICDKSNSSASNILRCCNSDDYCNLANDFLPSPLEARRILVPVEPRQPRLSRDTALQRYLDVPFELKLAFVVLASLLLILTLAYARSLWSGRVNLKKRRRRKKKKKRASESEAAALQVDITSSDSASMASREPLIDSLTCSLNLANRPAGPINLMYHSNSLNHPHPARGPWMSEDEIQGKAQSTFQMTIGSGDPLTKPETSSGSGSGQPYLTQRSIAHDIELVELVGRGYFGVVWRAEYKGQPVAVKIFSAMSEPSWEREVEIYQTTLLRHKNILGFIATDKRADETNTSFWLVTDFYPMGSLGDFLRQNSLSMTDALRMAFSIANGLAHLHMEIFGTQGKPAIAHRDLKSKNILVKNDATCCIADLGMAVRYNSNTGIVDVPSNTRVGTRRYLAPEVLDDKLNLMDFEGVKATDVYALSLVLWEILRRTCYNGPAGPEQACAADAAATERPATEAELNVSDSTSLVDDLDDELAYVCDKYELPYQEFVESDPSTDEMREIVCVQKLRPSQSARWFKFAAMRDYVTLMRECWYEKPQARLSALRVKKTLGDLAKRYYDLNMEYD